MIHNPRVNCLSVSRLVKPEMSEPEDEEGEEGAEEDGQRGRGLKRRQQDNMTAMDATSQNQGRYGRSWRSGVG